MQSKDKIVKILPHFAGPQFENVKVFSQPFLKIIFRNVASPFAVGVFRDTQRDDRKHCHYFGNKNNFGKV